MRKHHQSFLIFALITSMIASTSLFGADKYIRDGMCDKGTHGVVNLFSGWTEIPIQIVKGYDRGIKYNKEKPALSRTFGTIQGFFKGCSHAVGRTVLGAYQLVGFWSANPDHNDGYGVPVDGEYARDWGEHHNLTYKEIPEPMGRKVKRGAINAFSSPVEVPYQMKFGHRKKYKNGAAKGTWFMASRIWSGVYETTTFAFPSALDTEGYAFDQEYAGREHPDKVGPTWDKRPWLKELHRSQHN